MVLHLDAADITALLRRGTKGRDLVTVQSIGEDSLVLQMVFPRQLVVTLQRFILTTSFLTADLTPWWVRNLVHFYLKWRGDNRAKIEGTRIQIELPEKALEMIRINSFRVEEGQVSVYFDVKEDLGLG